MTDQAPPAPVVYAGVSIWQLMLVQMMTIALIAGGAFAFVKFGPGIPGTEPNKPNAALATIMKSVFVGETAERDRYLVGAQYAVFADLVEQDAQFKPPLLDSTAAVYDKMRLIGFANVGPAWNMGKRYPQLPSAIESFLRDRGFGDDPAPLSSDRRAAFVVASREIAEACFD